MIFLICFSVYYLIGLIYMAWLNASTDQRYVGIGEYLGFSLIWPLIFIVLTFEDLSSRLVGFNCMPLFRKVFGKK